MLGGGAAGFESAPVVKGILACAAGSVLFAGGYGGATGRAVWGPGLPSPAELTVGMLASASSASVFGGGAERASSAAGAALGGWATALPLSALASQLAFSSMSELFSGAILLYTAGRHCERCHGSRRFAALACVAGCASVAAQCWAAAASYSQSAAFREVRC